MESIQYYKAVLAPRVLEEQNWKTSWHSSIMMKFKVFSNAVDTKSFMFIRIITIL